MIELPACLHRGRQIGQDRWRCTAPSLVVAGGTVSADTCRRHCPLVARPAVPHADTATWPLVSCLMPTRDRPGFAAIAIRQFLAQDYPHAELIIIDDGTVPLAEELVAHPRIRYVRLAQAQSIGAKRNHACREAQGSILVQWDDDDWHGVSRLSRQVAPLVAEEADITGLSQTLLFDLGRLEFWKPSAESFRRLAFAGVHCGTLAFRREVCGFTCYPDASQGEDVAFLRPALAAGCRIVPVPGGADFVYVRHGTNVSRIDDFYRRFGARRIAPPKAVASDLPHYRRLRSRLASSPNLSASAQRLAVAQPQPKSQVVGDRIAALTRILGIQPCNGTEQQHALLNRADAWLASRGTGIVARGSLAIVTPYFNPAGWPQLAENFRAYRELLGDAPLYTAEVSFGSQQWLADGLRLRGGPQHVLWQKERLINLAVAALPAEFDRVAWIDGDIVLPDPEWYDHACRALDAHPVVQIGDAVIAGGRQHKLWAASGFDPGCSKIGYAWAARRELFPLYDAAIIGGGDVLCALGWLGSTIKSLTPSPQWLYHYDTWARRAYAQVKARIGHVPGTIVHLDHGSHRGRQYNERYQLVRGLDPEVDLMTDASGLWAWSESPAAAAYQAAVAGYFRQRND